jgi:hypothetical protein
MRIRRLALALTLILALAIGVWVVLRPGVRDAAATPLSYEELTGSLFSAAPKNPLSPPRVRELALPAIANGTSVWGATGRDLRGHVWVGVSAQSAGMSAHLFEYQPDQDAWYDRGAVVDQLQAAGLRREGEGQVKIHSKIVQALDGWLYFASTDEEGESGDGRVLPRWGGHLWRYHPVDQIWQHLMATPEGLVAVSGVGRYVYALGYFGHVLYQYDSQTGATRQVEVGSVGGHVSRNFLAAVNGHAFVPRVTNNTSADPSRTDHNSAVSVELVEYDQAMQPIGATRLEHYLNERSLDSNHGIVGLAYLPDGRMLFTTHIGHLYLIAPRDRGPALITPLGWMHPDGAAYAPSLFFLGGSGWLGGVVQRQKGFDWVVTSLGAGGSAAFQLDTGGLRNVLLYGSVTRDNAGRAYLAGWAEKGGGGGQRPLVLQLTPGE